MKTARKITLLSLVVLCCLIVFGCGKDDESAPTTPPTAPDKPTTPKVDAGTAKMDVEQLRAAALKCKAAIDTKIDESDELAQKLIKSLGGDDPKETARLKTEITELNETAEVLVKQLKAYIDQLKEKGGDVSGLEIGK